MECVKLCHIRLHGFLKLNFIKGGCLKQRVYFGRKREIMKKWLPENCNSAYFDFQMWIYFNREVISRIRSTCIHG